jgi:hypothetical protein
LMLPEQIGYFAIHFHAGIESWVRSEMGYVLGEMKGDVGLIGWRELGAGGPRWQMMDAEWHHSRPRQCASSYLFDNACGEYLHTRRSIEGGQPERETSEAVSSEKRFRRATAIVTILLWNSCKDYHLSFPHGTVLIEVRGLQMSRLNVY